MSMKNRFGYICYFIFILGCASSHISENGVSDKSDSIYLNCLPKIINQVPIEIQEYRDGIDEEVEFDVFYLKNGATSSFIHLSVNSDSIVKKTFHKKNGDLKLHARTSKVNDAIQTEFEIGECESVIYTTASDLCSKEIAIYKGSELIYLFVIENSSCSDSLGDFPNTDNIKQLKEIW